MGNAGGDWVTRTEYNYGELTDPSFSIVVSFDSSVRCTAPPLKAVFQKKLNQSINRIKSSHINVYEPTMHACISLVAMSSCCIGVKSKDCSFLPFQANTVSTPN